MKTELLKMCGLMKKTQKDEVKKFSSEKQKTTLLQKLQPLQT